MPTLRNKENSKAWYKPNNNKKKQECSNLPFPLIDPYQRNFQMAEKNGYYPNYPTVPYKMPMLRNNQNVADNNKQAVIARAPEENNNRDIFTIEQHQQRVNREISNLGARRGQV